MKMLSFRAKREKLINNQIGSLMKKFLWTETLFVVILGQSKIVNQDPAR